MSAEFREWVHGDTSTKDDKLRLMRTLHTEDEDEQEMLAECRAQVGGALVNYAIGPSSVHNVKPYGLKAARSTDAFKGLPSTTLSLTFAALYQAVRTDPAMFDKWVKSTRHSITNPWPAGSMKRFVQLREVFTMYRTHVFQAYELAGGAYMGTESDADAAPASNSTAVTDFEEDFEWVCTHWYCIRLIITVNQDIPVHNS